jgi:TPR repeat protein
MAKSMRYSKRFKKTKRGDLFFRAAKQEDKGKLRSAFHLYLATARAGDSSCQVNLGNRCDGGTGVQRNRLAARYWYKRAYRRGESSAAHNLGVMWRNERKFKRARNWFEKAVLLGDDEANLEIAKHYLQVEPDPVRAIACLEKVCKSPCVSQAALEEASKLLEQTKKRVKRI